MIRIWMGMMMLVVLSAAGGAENKSMEVSFTGEPAHKLYEALDLPEQGLFGFETTHSWAKIGRDVLCNKNVELSNFGVRPGQTVTRTENYRCKFLVSASGTVETLPTHD